MQIPRGGLVTVDAMERAQRRGGGAAAGAHSFQDSGPLTEVLPGLLASRVARRHWLDAMEAGWRPSCTTAAAAHGLWVPPLPESTFHGYRRRSGRAQAPAGTVSHGWQRTWPEDDPVASVELALMHAVKCRGTETALILGESALNQRLISMSRWLDIAAGATLKKQRRLAKARSDAQSGSETRVRLGLESHRIPVEGQVFFDGVGRVDLVLGGVLVIECDSHAHHSSSDAQDRDRRRDFELQRRGYTVIRLSYQQIWENWPETLEQIVAVYRRIRHRALRPLIVDLSKQVRESRKAT